MGTINRQVQGRHQSGSRRKLSALASKISEHKLRLPCFTVLFHTSAWTHEGHAGALLAGVCLSRGQWGRTCRVELVEFCSPRRLLYCVPGGIPSGGCFPLALQEALPLLLLRDHPLLPWPACPPACPSQTCLTLFMLPALRSHTRGPFCRHLEALSWLRASPALLCVPGGRGDTLVLGKLSVPADGHGVGGLRALEPARHKGEKTLSSLLAEGALFLRVSSLARGR